MIDKRLIRETGSKIDRATIIAFESDYKVHFPNDYFNFLLEYGNVGIILSRCVLEVSGDIITNIHGLDYIKGAIEWIKELESLTNYENVISDKMLPIAETAFNSFCCIYNNPSDTTIYRVNFQLTGSLFSVPVADSFTDFLSKLTYNPDL